MAFSLHGTPYATGAGNVGNLQQLLPTMPVHYAHCNFQGCQSQVSHDGHSHRNHRTVNSRSLSYFTHVRNANSFTPFCVTVSFGSHRIALHCTAPQRTASHSIRIARCLWSSLKGSRVVQLLSIE